MMKEQPTSFHPDEFQHPPAIDRGAPFWCWNGSLNQDELKKQIETFAKMHMGGATIHARVGLEDEYLGEHFMNMVRYCQEEFAKHGMLTWLYDEDRYPSGSAGGLVTKDRRCRTQMIRFTPEPIPHDRIAADMEQLFSDDEKEGVLLAIYDIVLKDGYLASYKQIADPLTAKGDCWYAYICLQAPTSWYNNQSYANTMDPATVRRFIETTYEAYDRLLGPEFGKTIPAIFTDEPQMQRKGFLAFSTAKTTVNLPFTYDMLESYPNQYGTGFLPTLPELIFNLPDNTPSQARYRYHDHTAERFVTAFVDQIGTWCEQHNIMLTGHMNSEHDLYSQTSSIGDAMRCYRSFQQPGIDVLADHKEYITAKQCVSVARQRKINHVTCEIYGVTNWDFPMSGYKLQGDWLAALGITTRVHHLTHMGLQGETKRDYPASIGAHVPWHNDFALLEDHYSRLNTALRCGTPVVRVGVIHPIESYWLLWGPRDANMTEREGREADLKAVTESLLFSNIDFDFISESLLPGQCLETPSAPFTVGEMSYDVIIVPGNLTIRETTLKRLESFYHHGGKVIWAGEMPSCVDGTPDSRARQFAEQCVRIPITRAALVREVNAYRDIEIRDTDGSLCNNLLYQLRDNGDERFLFICHGQDKRSSWSAYLEPYLNQPAVCEHVIVKIKGTYQLELLDTFTGTITPYPAEIAEGYTTVRIDFYPHDSRLLRLTHATCSVLPLQPEPVYTAVRSNWPSLMPYTLSEPNIFMLDMPEWKLDGGEWQDREEILRIDSQLREQFGYHQRMDSMAQPYAVQLPNERDHLLELRFHIDSETSVHGARLALEQPEYTKIYWDGELVDASPEGFYVDKAIRTVPMPLITKGTHILILAIDFGPRSDLEWIYLLGAFGVTTAGTYAKMTALPEKLAFDNIVTQGFPFYGGDVTWHLEWNCPEDGHYKLRIPKFNATVLRIALDTNDLGVIAYSPYEINLGMVQKGMHAIDLTMRGNRINTFGQIHMNDEACTFFGPTTWRTKGDCFTYEYRLKTQGILSSPILYKREC